MKHLLPISIAFVLAAAGPASAEPQLEKDVGIGLAVGAATGPNVQVKTTPSTHLAVGLGLEHESQLRLQLDHAWRIGRSSSTAVSVPVYLGLGAYLVDRDFGPTDLGFRLPVGVQVELARAPLQVFGELAPEVLVAQFYDRPMDPPSTDLLAVTGLAGVRAAF